MIIVFGGIKGGSGKTTLATNLTVMRALSGKKVLMVDADEQHSASDWSEHRESLKISTPWVTIKLSGAAVRTEILKMREHFDDVIIDTGGRDTTSQRAALTIADIFIAPFQPRSYDIWTINKVSELISEIKTINPKITCLAVINRADSIGKDNIEAADIIKECPTLKLLEVLVGQRKIFANSTSSGLGIIESKPTDKKAISEMKDLYNEIFNTKLAQK